MIENTIVKRPFLPDTEVAPFIDLFCTGFVKYPSLYLSCQQLLKQLLWDSVGPVSRAASSTTYATSQLVRLAHVINSRFLLRLQEVSQSSDVALSLHMVCVTTHTPTTHITHMNACSFKFLILLLIVFLCVCRWMWCLRCHVLWWRCVCCLL